MDNGLPRPPPQESDLKFDNMTRQDLKKIEKSMKRPQFLGLLNEYMIQISDPKNKNEYDEYLRQMERQRQLPKHMKIVELKPRFCFRTFIVSQKNKKHQMKFFINVCETEYLEKPSCEPTAGEDGKIGYSWKIPNSIGKIRYDQDKQGSPCQVVDIAFHPDTFHFAVKKQFQEMMINISLEGAEKQLTERKETLSKDYVILKNVICKGQDGKPALMPIRYIQGKIYNKGEGPNDEPERDSQGRQTKLQRQINKSKEEHQKTKQKEKQAKKDDDKEQQQLQDDKKMIVDMQKGVQRPKYSTIFTYPVDYSQFIDNPAATKRKVPSVFNIQFQIPRVQSMQQIAGQTLQINDKKILLKIGQKYFIDLQFQQFKLKYQLLTANSKAKYDKKKKSLRIVIPVDQSVKYYPNQHVDNDTTRNQLVEAIQDEKKDSVVESETWKNKILDFTQSSVSVKMLNQESVEQAPKLVEEIDQEDQVSEAKTHPVNHTEHEDDDKEEERVHKPQKFSLSTYYDKKPQVKAESKRIGYTFQETKDSIVIVIQMKNYKKTEIQTFIDESTHQIFIQWNQNVQGEQKLELIRFQHLKVRDQFNDKIQKISVVQRVSFVCFMIIKKIEQKGKYWNKECISQVGYEGDSEDHVVQQFRQTIRQKKDLLQKNKIIQDLKEEEILQKTKVTEQIIEESKIEVKEQKPIETRESSKSGIQSVSQTTIFSNLQPQFISFNIPFIDILD